LREHIADVSAVDKPPRRVRKAISKKVRFEVFKRDGFCCQYCGAHPPGILLHVDHIEAVANGGLNDFDNLVTSCEACNLGKGAAALTAVPEALSERAARVAEAEAQLAGYSRIMEAQRERIDAEVWRIVEVLTGQRLEIDRRQYQSIKAFVERLGLHEVIDAAEISLGSHIYSPARKFRYFCGICWNKIADIGR
jgi:hypothetical protein